MIGSTWSFRFTWNTTTPSPLRANLKRRHPCGSTRPASKELGMEGERRGNMSREVRRIVAPGIDMKFVRDFAGREDFVKRGRTCLEAEIVPVATIEINFHSGEIRGAGQHERAVGLPESCVRRDAENAAEDARPRRLRGADKSRKFFDESGAVRADRAEELRMTEGKMQRAVAAHGDSGNRAVGPPR